MKIVINQDFTHLKEFIENIPNGNYKTEYTYCNKRNVVERVKVGEDIIVIKRYKRPTIANCIVYTFFRKNKARRSFEYAKRLLKIGIDTAKPIAYIELNSYGFFHTGYYISEWLPYTPLPKIFAETKEKEKIKNEFINFALNLHMNKVWPGDYNPNNILVKHTENGFKFALIDINHMKFNKIPSIKNAMKSMVQLTEETQILAEIIPAYAKLRGKNEDKSLFFCITKQTQDKRKNYNKKT
ncbi:MAG: hypothetical protein IJ669_07540 [Prevotella sp.]|nr:hypothetical protein [Prevotella sp.]